MSERWIYARCRPRDVQSVLQCSLQEASRLVTLHSLMAEIDKAETVTQLKTQLMTYIEWKERL